MSRRPQNATPVRRLIQLLNENAEFIERVFHERESHVSADDEFKTHQLTRLRRERLVRIEPDGSGGFTVRLTSQVRNLLGTTTRNRRLQSVGVDVREALENASHLVTEWKAAAKNGHIDAADDLRDEVIEVLDNVELLYDEQLDGLQEKIGITYGFDERATQRARDFKLYIKRLDDMYRGADEFLTTLQGDEFSDIPFVAVFATKLASRFGRHGVELTRLISELERYINRVRERQAQTRRNLRFLQWLRKQPSRPRVPSAETTAADLGILHRARPILLGGRPDFSDPILEPVWAEIQRHVRRRQRALELARRPVERDKSEARINSGDLEREARDWLRCDKARQWRSQDWVHEFLQTVVREARRCEEAPDVSAVDFYCEQLKRAQGGEITPTLRAWVHEVAQLAFTDRPVGGRKRFFEQFEVRVSPPLPQGVAREPIVLQDLLWCAPAPMRFVRALGHG